ncbi:DUF4229 domain-containing protein [Rhodococcus sp. TAF43]|uniref:DUF4229 domain-containing protein n=1 Tax=unclassified Rhodococcus (in: high G+C Gram-positive bacteria) TaxID=192944 RepID=UPI000E09EEEB|nr:MULTISPECIES: DUF4229 domain-containing protein [unclassified Rhodococcus (in: high G+C Gram-positive bacteria)]QKT12920.1 DUF4229 domain-containing protein [Rhodococcus sp. W8901]RDI33808.1 uncharacterized protein DUF4229 [Rhodococcus sp. AG1013]
MSDAAQNRPEKASEQGADAAPTVTTGHLVRDVVLYSVARLGLVVILLAVILLGGKLIGVEVPWIVAALFAVLIALPLSLVLFSKLRKRVNEDIASVDARRRADKADLHAKLRGEDRKQ